VKALAPILIGVGLLGAAGYAVIKSGGLVAPSTRLGFAPLTTREMRHFDSLAGGYYAEVDDDRMTGLRSTRMLIATTYSGPQYASAIHLTSTCQTGIELHLSRAESGPDDTLGTAASLDAAIDAGHWLFIEGPALVLVDSIRSVLKELGKPYRHVSDYEGVFEFVSYQMTPYDLIRLARATGVRMRLSGSEGYCDFDIPPVSRAKMAQFLLHQFPPSLNGAKPAPVQPTASRP
jgi:hypothetical protein